MSGLSRQSVTRECEKLYCEKKIDVNLTLSTIVSALTNYCKTNVKLISISHDIWSSVQGKSFMGVTIHAMDITQIPWKIETLTLACVHHPSPHDAERNLAKIEQVLSDWGIPLEMLMCSTQDTTGNSINVFKKVKTTEIFPCCSHTSQLFVKHTSNDVPVISSTFDAMNTCATKLKGYPKRLQELFRLCREVKIKELAPRKICLPRWNTREQVATRSIDLLPAYRVIQPEIVFDKPDIRRGWIDSLLIVESNVDIMNEFLPLMRTVAQWTQVLTSQQMVTISLVRLMIRRLRNEVANLKRKANAYQRGSAFERTLSVKLQPLHASAEKWIDHYYNDEYYNYGLLRVAEFLDPRTCNCIEDKDELDIVQDFLKLFVSKEASSVPRGKGGAQAVGLAAAIETKTNKSPLEKEIQLYSFLMVSKTESVCNAINPLEFWPGEGSSFPILAGVAARVLPTPPTSASDEQLFSVGGRIVTSARSRLNAHHVNELCCLHQLLLKYDDDMISREATRKADKTAKTDKRFAYLNLRLEINGPEIIESDEDEDDDDD